MICFVGKYRCCLVYFKFGFFFPLGRDNFSGRVNEVLVMNFNDAG